MKSSNILLDENWAAKISDFGLSRTGPADQECTDVTTKHIKGTFGYMDPDYFLTHRFTRKTDVFAFGVVLLEVLSERPAVDRSILDEDQWGLAGWGQQCICDGVPHQLIGPNITWEILQTSLVEFVGIAGQCLHSRPKKRPTMSEVVAKLELALALQLRTDVLLDDSYFSCLWPFDSQNSDSYTKDKPTEHVGDSLEAPMVLEKNAAKPSGNDNNRNSKSPDEFGDVIEDVAITSGKIVTPNLRKFTFSELRSATKNFKDVLGEGGFGRVYKGWIDKKTCLEVVAIKRLNPESLQGQAEGLMEVDILGNFSHPNLVKLLGYYDKDDGLYEFGRKENGYEFLLVYEYMPNRSLDSHLFGKLDENLLSWDTRLKIATGAARALSFLHATDDQIIVRDIKSQHILLDKNFHAKLSGFGLAKIYPDNGETHITTRAMGTYGYAAPEHVATGHLCPKSDVYSFGVVLLELLTGMRALDMKRQSGMQHLVDWVKPLLSHKASVKRKLVDPRLKIDHPPEGAFELALLIEKCLQIELKLRPSMKQVLQNLEHISSIKPEIRKTQADTSKSMWSWTRNLKKITS